MSGPLRSKSVYLFNWSLIHNHFILSEQPKRAPLQKNIFRTARPREFRQKILKRFLRYRAYGLLLMFALLQSCALGKRSSIDASKLTAAEILEKVDENNQRIRTLAGKGNLIIEMPETPFRGEVTIRVIRPDSLYIVTEAAFGVDVGFLFADGEHFYSYSPIDNTYLFGDAEQIGSLVFFNMRIGYQELLNSILGAARFPMQENTRIERFDDKIVFAQSYQGKNLIYEIDPDRLVITRIQLFDRASRETFRQEFRRFREVDGIWVPRHIQLTRPLSKERMTVWYSKIELNRGFTADAFSYNVPENAKRKNVSRKQEE